MPYFQRCEFPDTVDCNKPGQEGDECTTNGDCHGDLVCDGNLKKCRKESTQVQPNITFCSQDGRLCQEGEGDCDGDSECAGSLKCGVDNCNRPEQNTWDAAADCCYALVQEGGVCQINDDCQGDLVCDGNLKKCRKESTDLGQYDGSFCSAGGRLCQEGEGDCDGDNECAGSLKCGEDNCNRPEQNTWPSHYDCCYQP